MKVFFDCLVELRDKCDQLATDLSNKLGVSRQEAPLVSLAHCYNHATLLAEQILFYNQNWLDTEHTIPPHEAEIRRNQQYERLEMSIRMLFVMCLSSMEFAAKPAAKKQSAVLHGLNWNGRVYLGGILKESKERGLITESDLGKWRALIFLRNCIVHNNGWSDEDWNTTITPTLLFVAKAGVQMVGQSLDPARMIIWAVQAYGEWCKDLLTHAKAVP